MSINKNNYEAWFLDYFEGSLSTEQVAELFLFLEQHPELREELDSFEMIQLSDDQPKFQNKEILKQPEPKINDQNFEEYCIAYIEGQLNSTESAELTLFAKMTDSREKTFRIYSKMKLIAEDIRNNEKGLLYKNVSLVSTAPEMRDLMLIAFTEGWLNQEETAQVQSLLNSDSQLSKEAGLYASTILKADTSITFPYPERLKKKESAVVPFYSNRFVQYAAAAVVAGILFLSYPFEKEDSSALYSERNATELINTSEKIDSVEAEEFILPVVRENLSNTIAKKNTRKVKGFVKSKENIITPQQEEIPQQNIVEEKKDSTTILNQQIQIANQTPSNDTAKTVQKVDESIAAQGNNQTSPESFSIWQFIKRKANEKLFGSPEPTQEEKDLAISEGISSVTGKEVKIARTPTGEGSERVDYSFGSLGFSRNSSK